jgi:hypothetical protein
MPTVVGFWATIGFGLIGALLAELIRLTELLRSKRPLPGKLEILGSALYVLTGGFVFLFGWNDPQKMISLAALGAAFPYTFAGLVRAKEAAEVQPAERAAAPLAGTAVPRNSRRWLDFMGSRF